MILQADLTLQGFHVNTLGVLQRSSQDVSLTIYSPNEGVFTG